MKNKFNEFLVRRETEITELWKNAVFVFDSSVLLNFYRYTTETQESLLKALKDLNGRIWMPYHAALEFQRNRSTVIAGQLRTHATYISELLSAKDEFLEKIKSIDRETKEKRNRYFDISSNPFLQDVENLAQKFITELKEQGNLLQTLNKEDPLLEKIEFLFDGKIGNAPINQSIVDKLYTEADNRFKYKIPPGYMDDDKDKKHPDEYLHKGIIYKRKYGDFINWIEILEFAKTDNLKSIVFVTDDNKEDWWSIVDADLKKTIGPRPELIDEAKSRGEIENFWMYKPARFLQFAQENLEANVSNNAIQEIDDISRAFSDSGAFESSDQFTDFSAFVMYYSMEKLKERFKQVSLDQRGSGFYCMNNAVRHVQKVFFIGEESVFFSHLERILQSADDEMKERSLNSITIAFVVDNSNAAKSLLDKITEISSLHLSGNLYIAMIIANLSSKKADDIIFYADIRFNKINIFSGEAA